jgi:hypothetical protein
MKVRIKNITGEPTAVFTEEGRIDFDGEFEGEVDEAMAKVLTASGIFKKVRRSKK